MKGFIYIKTTLTPKEKKNRDFHFNGEIMNNLHIDILITFLFNEHFKKKTVLLHNTNFKKRHLNLKNNRNFYLPIFNCI